MFGYNALSMRNCAFLQFSRLAVSVWVTGTYPRDTCLCPANNKECAASDVKGNYCNQCIPYEYQQGSLANKEAVDCLYGTDKSHDGKMIQNYIHPQLFHYLFYHGDWRCINPKSNRVKHCNRLNPESVFLLSFPYHEVHGCDLFGTLAKFWHCTEAGQCVREGYACVNRNVKGERYCPRGQTPETAFFESVETYCVQKICPRGTWPCHERCIGREEPCGQRCDGTIRYCPGLKEKPSKCILMPHIFCESTKTCGEGWIYCPELSPNQCTRQKDKGGWIFDKDLNRCVKDCQDEDKWYCNHNRQCINSGQTCNHECRPGMVKCYSDPTTYHCSTNETCLANSSIDSSITTLKTPFQGRDVSDVDTPTDDAIKCPYPNITCILYQINECGMPDSCTACIPRNMSCNVNTCKLYNGSKICNSTVFCNDGPCATKPSGLDFSMIGILAAVIVILLIILVIVAIKCRRRRAEPDETDDQVSFNAAGGNVDFSISETNEYYEKDRNAYSDENYYYGKSDNQYEVNISDKNEYYGE